MPNCTFGIDHPVVTVRDHAAVLQRYRALGFAPSPLSYHPWGTVLSLLMFKDNFIELIGVADAAKFGVGEVNGFCYGRNVGRFLERAEGLGLVALHSTDADADHARLRARGLASQGRIDFRRAMQKPDGSPDTAVVSLGLFINEDEAAHDVSHFLCQQHRPELIWVPAWQQHPNGAVAVTAVTYLARDPQALAARFAAIYGADRLTSGAGRLTTNQSEFFTADSGCGVFRVLDRAAVHQQFGEVALPWRQAEAAHDCAHGVAITVATTRFDALEALWRERGVTAQRSPQGALVLAPQDCGNVILEFVPA